MAESVERYFRLMPMGRKQRPAERTWCPAADVYQTQYGWIVKVEIAGVRIDELEISIEGSTLRIGGCRRDTFYGETVSYHQIEITYSRFEKTLQFPSRIDAATIERDYRDGLLILYLRSSEDKL
ncbi:MAG: Hsp20/alpha crystallin family protein [Pyrinomonadaceae bacterium]|nr:Hsp20/alpha crystallin family protein [Pyrinomonadaceae bacterium]